MDVAKQFLLCGLTRLTARVAAELVATGHRVRVLHSSAETPEPDLFARHLPIPVERVDGSVSQALEQFDWSDVACILALSARDDDNLHVALTAHTVAPHVPVVLRAFDEALAQALEQGTNVRAAFSVSALAAPSFVGAALSEEVLATLILGDARVLICQVVVRAEGRLNGRSRRQIEASSRCRVLWASCDIDESTPAGTTVVLGGLLEDILALARDNAPPRPTQAPAPRVRRRAGAGPRRRTAIYAATALGVLLTIATAVFVRALGLSPLDAVYFVVTTLTTTGYGDITLRDASPAVKGFGIFLMVADTVLLAMLFAHLAAWMTTDRFDLHMGRRAARMTHHAVIAGLGNVGYRVQRVFGSLGIPTVVMERGEHGRFADVVREQSVVLRGDASLPESLEAAAVSRARYFVAVTDNDMTNIQATLQARRLNPSIRTVTRIMDPRLAELLPRGFALDAVLNPTAVATDAFVGAATNQRAPRSFEVAGSPWTALRWTCSRAFTPQDRAAWGEAELHVVAVEGDRGALVPAPRGVGLALGTTVVLAGPADAVARLLDTTSQDAGAGGVA